jgi:PAS domain S-box-containing protein
MKISREEIPVEELKLQAENSHRKITLDSQENPTEIQGINLDITDLKKTEIELQQLNVILEERVKQRTAELTSVYQRLQNELEERQQIEREKQHSEEFYSEYLERELIERQRMERALSESEMRYRRIVETSSEGIWQLDEENQTVFVNPRMAEMLGYSVEEMVEKNLLDFLLETKQGEVQYRLEQLQDLILQPYDVQFYRKDGSILWGMVSTRQIRDESGQCLGYLKMVTDISDRKQSEAILKEFNRRWRSVLDNIQMIVVQLDRRGVVQYINPFFLKTYQLELEEVISQNWLDKFVPARLRPTIDKVFEEVLYHAHSYYENPILIKPNEERIIGWRNCSLKDDLGQVSGIIAIGEDITERHYLEKMKSEFISIVSHELKTPLTTIQASLSLLDGKFIDPSSKEGEETISIATEAVDRLARLVDDILDLERLRSGKLTMLKTNCNTQNIIEGAIAQTKELVNQTEIDIKVPRESFSCFADSDRLIQVLTNLISNAIKFSPHQSMIELSVEPKNPDPNQEIDAKPYLLFAIRDRGRGIPAQNLQSIFERFQQVDASDSREKGGTGLGLAICQDIVEQHGGKIWAESVLGQGTTFFFTIPIESTEATSDDN